MENMETQFINNNPSELIDEVKDYCGTQSNLNKRMKYRYKKQSCIFSTSEVKETDYNQLYQSLLNKEYVDLRSDIDSSAVIHILMKSEKNKLEQNFIKNAIQGLQLFEKHKNLLTAQGFGNHLFSQMKVEFHEKNSIIFHYGDYGNKYYIVLKGKVDLLMPKSEYIEENNSKSEKGQATSPYFNESRTIVDELPDETFEQYIERVYPKLGFIKTFMPGEAFGEIALMTNQQRTGSIIAREDSYSLVITKSAFHEILGQFHEFMQMQKLEFLSQFFFIKHIPKSKLLSIIQFMKIFKYQRNNVIYSEKQNTSGIYFIREGEIQISTKIVQLDSDDKDESHKLKISFRNAKKSEKVVIKATNTFFGEEEIILNAHTRNSKAICLSETCEVYLLTRDILNTYGKPYNVVKKLKQNYDLKAKWEQERTTNIQNIKKQNQENINHLNSTKTQEVSLSKFMIQQYNQMKGRQSFSGFPNQMTGSDEQIDLPTSSNSTENTITFQSSKKHRKLSYNMEQQIFLSPKNSKNKNDYSNPAATPSDRNNNFLLMNGFQSQNSSLKRQSSYLSPQTTGIKNIMPTMTPEPNNTARLNYKTTNMAIKNSNIQPDKMYEPYISLAENVKDVKPKSFLKSSMTSQQQRKKNSSLDGQFQAGFTPYSNNSSSVFSATNNTTTNNINYYNNNINNNNNNNNNSSNNDIFVYYNQSNQTNQSQQGKVCCSTNNSRETSVERIFYDSSHNEFESMLRKQTQMKQEILKQISKSKNPNLDGLTDINKQRIDFKIRKQSLQYIPSTPKSIKQINQQTSSSSFTSNAQVQKLKSQSQIPQDNTGNSDQITQLHEIKNNHSLTSQITQPLHFSSTPNIPFSTINNYIYNNDINNNINNNNNNNISDRVVIVPASMANEKIQLNFFSTKVQGNDQIQYPSLSSKNVQNNQLQSPHLNQQTSIQVNTQNQPTLLQLDTLLEEDDEYSPLKIGKKQNIFIPKHINQDGQLIQSILPQKDKETLEMEKNAAILSKKFHLGKKVVKYIQSRKSFNEKLLVDLEKQTKIPSSQNTFNKFDEFMNSKQNTSCSPINNKVDVYPQKEVILQVKLHKRGGSILQNATLHMQQQQSLEGTKVGHNRRFTFDISHNLQKIQPKKELPTQHNNS